MEFSITNTIQVPKITSTITQIEKVPSTLEKIGGILCNICQQTFKQKKQIDEHYCSLHKPLKTIYTCIICYKEFLNYKIFHDHCYRHCSGKKLACEKCKKKFTSNHALQLHMEFHNEQKDNNTATHNSNQTYECKQCYESFAKFADLMNHSRNCGRQFNCSICNKSFIRKSLMLRHAVYHTEQRNFKCDVCCGTFKSKCDLKKHKLQHENNNKYKCGLCYKTFITSTKLKCHINTHNGHRPFSCEHCDATFTNNSNRIKHIKRVHSAQCCHSKLTLIETMNSQNQPERSPISNDAENIEVHGSIIINNGLQEFACSQCPMRFTCRRSWLRHVKRSHLNFKYMCISCSKVVVFPNPIQSYDTIPSSNSVKPFICDYCGAGFTDKNNLERHMIRAAHLKLDYKCRQCDRKFFSSLQLSAHKKFHQNEKPIRSMLSLVRRKNKGLPELYPCQCCDKKFSYHWSRVRHMRNEHGKKFDRTLNIIKSRNNVNQVNSIELSPVKKLDVPGSLNVFDMVSQKDEEKEITYSINTPLDKKEVPNSEQISSSLDQSLEIQSVLHYENMKNVTDEIDTDLLSYFDSYIHGHVDVDILKDTIDIPGFTEECVNLDNISPDFTLANMDDVVPTKIIQSLPAQDENQNITMEQNFSSDHLNRHSFNSNPVITSHEIMSFGHMESSPDNAMLEDNIKSFYNIRIVKTEREVSSPRKLLLQINPLFDSKQLISDETKISSSLFNNIYDSNQNLCNLIQNTVDGTSKIESE